MTCTELLSTEFVSNCFLDDGEPISSSLPLDCLLSDAVTLNECYHLIKSMTYVYAAHCSYQCQPKKDRL